MSGVLDLPGRLAALSAEQRARAERLFRIELVTGTTDPPPDMTAWLEEHFGSVDAVRRQHIVRVTNRWTLEGSLFSPLRSRRPIHGDGRDDEYARQIEATRGGPFCDPEHDTPADSWGRVRGAHAVTGANAAMYDDHHGVLVLREHDPLAFDEAIVREVLELGREWAGRSRAEDPDAANYLLIWNCGPRAGGSVIHGHTQLLLGRGAHYPIIERFQRDAQRYRAEAGSPYLDDLVAVHRDLGLVVAEADGVAVLSSLTPIKERELLVVGSPGMDEREPGFAGLLGRTVVAFRDALGVRAFNLALHRPPLGDGATPAGWEGIGPVVHLVDRGDPNSASSDIGAMELYAASVVGSDPYRVAERLAAALGPG